MRRFVIERDPQKILNYLPQIISLADSNKEALGFLPQKAYREYVVQRKVIVAIDATTSEYAGHLLFGGIYPSLRIYQTAVQEQFRGHGCGTLLRRALVSQAEQEQYSTICANVATDLEAANEFYERHKFKTARRKAGGMSRSREIFVKVRELDNENLLTLLEGHQRSVNFNIQITNFVEPPLYAIDLNVLFDLVRERTRSINAASLFEAALKHQIRLVTTSEFVAELERNSGNRVDDPILALAKRLPRIPKHDPSLIAPLLEIVKKEIFQTSDGLSVRDNSDAMHVTQAVASRVAGYITSDETVLNARDALFHKFNLDVIGLAEFSTMLETPAETFSMTSVTAKNFQIETNAKSEIIRAYLDAYDNNLSLRFREFASLPNHSHRFCRVLDQTGAVAISALFFASAIDAAPKLIILANETNPFASTIIDHLISSACQFLSQDTPARVQLYCASAHAVTFRIAAAYGFSRGPNGILAKIAFGRPITAKNWSSAVRQIERLSTLSLPLEMPRPGHANAEIILKCSDGSVTMPWPELENLFSPVFFAWPSREGVIVPIKRSFSSDLVGSDEQLSLLDSPEAAFLSNRTYYNSPRVENVMKHHTAIIFYESLKSKGRGAAVAIGRITEVTNFPKQEVPEHIQRSSVVEDLNALSSADRILATRFDNMMPFKRPVSLEKLREIGCVGKLNLVTATPVTSAHLANIIDAAF